MDVCFPRNLDEALDRLADGGGTPPVVPVAGGTDLLVCWHQREHEGLRLLDLSRLGEELGGLRLTDDALEIGALATFWDVRCAPAVAAAFPLLPVVAAQVGAVQIQTRGTWAGNVGNGSPAADGVGVLMAYEAAVVLRSRSGQREVPLDGYYTGYRRSVRRPDELIVALRLPRRRRRHEWFFKVGSRSAQTIAKVGVAAVCDTSGWRIVAHSVAPTVRRCRALESALGRGERFGSPGEIGRLLAADISPIDDIRSTARYRATVLARLLYYWLCERGLS